MTNHTIDVKGKRLGRIATHIATILQGKHTPSYEGRLEGEDTVTIKNIKSIEVTGNKYDEKKYYAHSGKPGHLKTRTYKQKFEKDPSWVLRRAVRLMLPKNKLNKRRLKRLVIE
jgi:large subunit ribosomal protein L13